LWIVKDDAQEDPSLRNAAADMFIHDRTDELRLGYQQFLLQIKAKATTA
jgi:hypothetical protein